MNSGISNLTLVGILWGMALFAAEPKAEKPAGKTVSMPIMTWHHPVLEPGVSEMTLLCTVVSVQKHPQVYNNPYHSVRLRIDERIHVAERYKKRLEGVLFVEAGDFRQRTVGERIILFAGGEPYEGDDFLMPCWSGTATDLGILLHPKDHSDFDANESLLQQLRAVAKGEYLESELMRSFANFCPAGVAETFIWRLRMKEARGEEKGEGSATKK